MLHTLKTKRQNDEPLTFELFQEDFRAFAIKQHGQQMYGNLPYGYHLAMVETILVDNDYKEYEYRAAAWLHDVLEDTKALKEIIIKYYGFEVYNFVAACTGVGENRKERNVSIYGKLNQIPKAAPVKVADRLANMRQGLMERNPKVEMYVKEHFDFSAAVRPLMTNNRRDSLLWAKLDDCASIAHRWLRELAEQKTLATINGFA